MLFTDLRKTTRREGSEMLGCRYKHGRWPHGEGAWGHAGDITLGFRVALRGLRSDPRGLRLSEFRKIEKASTCEGDQEVREMKGNRGSPSSQSRGDYHKHSHMVLRDHVKGKRQMALGLDHVWATGELW